MPLLASYPVINLVDVDLYTDFAESRTFAFRSLDGSTILPFTGNEFIARWGIQNLDVPDRQLVEETYPNIDGTKVTDIHIGSRAWSIPIFVGSNSGHLQYLRNRGIMRQFFSHQTIDYLSAGGTFDLVARSALGERTLRSFYTGGMNGQWDQEVSGTHWETFGLQATAPWPYWNDGRWSSEVIRQPGPTEDWFARFPARLSARNVLNADPVVTVEGDVESWPSIEVVGPCSSLTVASDGLMLDVPDGLVAGEFMRYDTDPRNPQVLFNEEGGTDAWSRVSPLTIAAPLNPGPHIFTMTVPDPGPATSVQVSGTKWRETPW